MNYIMTLSLKNIQKNKRRYLNLYVAIVFALLFVYFASFLSNSIANTNTENQGILYGYQDVVYFNVSEDTAASLSAEEVVKANGQVEIIAVGIIGEETFDSSTGKMEVRDYDQISLAKMDAAAKEIAYYKLSQGRYPESPGEIALEEFVLSRLRLTPSVGDSINLGIKTPDGKGGFLSEETEATYTITGILRNKSTWLRSTLKELNPGYRDYPAGIVSDAEEILPGGRKITNIYVQFESDSDKALAQLHEKYKGVQSDTDATYHEPGQSSGAAYSSNKKLSYISTIPLMFIVVACVGIYGAYNSLINARYKQLGLLRAVGASKRAIAQMLLAETLIMILLAVPVSLGVSMLISSAIVNSLSSNMYFSQNISTVVLITLAGIGVISLSALMPLIKAFKVTPIAAIHGQTETVNKKKKRFIKSSHTDNVTGLLAHRIGKASSKSSIGLKATVALSLVVFTMAQYYLFSIERPMASSKDSYDYRLYLSGASYSTDAGFDNSNYIQGYLDSDIADMLKIDAVERVAGIKKISPVLVTTQNWPVGVERIDTYSDISILQDPSILSAHAEVYEAFKQSFQNIGISVDGANIFRTTIEAGDARYFKDLEPYIYEGEINIDKLNSGEEIVVFYPRETYVYQQPDELNYVDENGNKHISYWMSYDEKQNMDNEKNGYTLVDHYMNDDVHAGDIVDFDMIYSLVPNTSHGDPTKIYSLEDAAHINAKVKIGALIYGTYDQFNYDKSIFDVFFSTNIPFYSYTTTQGLATMGFPGGYKAVEVFLKDGITTEENRFVQDALKSIAYRVPRGEISESMTELNKVSYDLYLMNRITGYSIVLLLVFITILMLTNFVSSQLNTNKRGIGILRAVGTSRRELNKIYFIEITRFFIPSVVIGAILAVIARVFVPTLVQYIQLGEAIGFWEGLSRITFPIWELGVFCAALYATAVVTLLIMTRNQLKQNVIDNIGML